MHRIVWCALTLEYDSWEIYTTILFDCTKETSAVIHLHTANTISIYSTPSHTPSTESWWITKWQGRPHLLRYITRILMHRCWKSMNQGFQLRLISRLQEAEVTTKPENLMQIHSAAQQEILLLWSLENVQFAFRVSLYGWFVTLKADIMWFLWLCVIILLWWCQISLLNMVKLTKFELDIM